MCEICGSDLQVPTVGTILNLPAGLARVSHVGGFVGVGSVKGFLREAGGKGGACCSFEELCRLKHCKKRDMRAQKVFWVGMEFFQFTVK